jgi:flagellar protein FlgJ
MDPQPLLATDARSLDALRRQAGADPKSAVRAAAGQFESVFMRQMLKAMRDAVPKSGMWDGPAQSTYTDMLDQQMTQTLSGRPGGLAEVIARQLSRQIGGPAGRVRHGRPWRTGQPAASLPRHPMPTRASRGRAPPPGRARYGVAAPRTLPVANPVVANNA